MTIELNSLSSRELDSLISQARRRQSQLKRRKAPALVRKKIEALAAAEGYALAELYTVPSAARRAAAATSAKPASPRKGRKLGKVAPKYRNPANTKETWSGRGLKPRWMTDLIKKGKKAEDFLIRK